MNTFQLGKDISGSIIYSFPLSDSGQQANLTADDSASFIVPVNCTKVLLQYTPGATVLVGSQAPSLPSGSFEESNGSMINPTFINVYGGQTIYFLAVDASLVTASFYE